MTERLHSDEFFMQRALDLALKAQGNTWPNPVVGAVIVHENRIIGEGYHHKAGLPHAEIEAIRSVRNPELLRESEMYVTLEPCAHYGKTPPCAVRLAEEKFRRVIIGAPDPTDKVNGKGVQILKDAGISVTQGILEKECAAANKRFFCFHTQKRPYILLKWAVSADGFMDSSYKQAAISGRLLRQWVHRIRAAEEGILVGSGTVRGSVS